MLPIPLNLSFQVDKWTLQALWTSLQPVYVDAGCDELRDAVSSVVHSDCPFSATRLDGFSAEENGAIQVVR